MSLSPLLAMFLDLALAVRPCMTPWQIGSSERSLLPRYYFALYTLYAFVYMTWTRPLHTILCSRSHSLSFYTLYY